MLGKDIHFVDVKLVQEKRACEGGRKFLFMSLEDFEAKYPQMRGCALVTYAKRFLDYALNHPCRTGNAGEASAVMIPPYTALECNWPAFGGGNCYSVENNFRKGDRCFKQTFDVVQQVAGAAPNLKVAVLDMSYWYESGQPDGNSWTFNEKNIFSDDRVIFMKQNALEKHHRLGKDVSMPPPPTSRVNSAKASSAFSQPLAQKKYFATFKGSIQGWPAKTAFRTKMLAAADGQDIIVVDKGGSTTSSKYDFDELMHSSKFGLIPRGDAEISFRFVEVICSGSVPVLLADNLVPPFDHIMKFEEYGVRIPEARVNDLKTILHAISDEQAEALRAKTRVMCEEHFQTLGKQFETVITHVLKRR